MERKIPVVYYLCRDRHLEHPHFINVPLSSPHGLYLKDVLNRLIALRGKGMPAMYSWSCKRSYKNGFIWQDLCEDDLVLPGPGNEYVLKGSELLDQSPPGITKSKLHSNPEHSRQEPNSASQEASPSSSSPPWAPPQEKDLSPTTHQSGSPSPEPEARRLAESGVYNKAGVQDASTQTDDRGRRRVHGLNTRKMGDSTDEISLDGEFNESLQGLPPQFSEIGGDGVSPNPTLSGASPSGGQLDTLESLIRAEVSRMNTFKILEEDVLVPTRAKLKPANILMQLITCGTISIKDHRSFGFIPTYKPRFSHVESLTPTLKSSTMMGELDCPSADSRAMRMRVDGMDTSGSGLIETRMNKEVGEEMPTHLSSDNEDRNCKSPNLKMGKDRVEAAGSSKCLPRTTKTTTCKQSRNEMEISPPNSRYSSTKQECGKSAPISSVEGECKRIDVATLVKGSSMDSHFSEEEVKVILIEERLASGARVIIQSRAPCTDNVDGSGS